MSTLECIVYNKPLAKAGVDFLIFYYNKNLGNKSTWKSGSKKALIKKKNFTNSRQKSPHLVIL